MSTFRVSIVDHSILVKESQWPVGNVQRTTMICCSLKGKMCRHSLFTLTGCCKDPKSIMLGSHCQQTILPLDISMRQIVHNDVNMQHPLGVLIVSHSTWGYHKVTLFPAQPGRDTHLQPIYPKKMIHAKQGHQNHNMFNSISSGHFIWRSTTTIYQPIHCK